MANYSSSFRVESAKKKRNKDLNLRPGSDIVSVPLLPNKAAWVMLFHSYNMQM